MYALAPFINSSAVTKSDTTSVNCTALYIGGTGQVDIKHVATGATVSFAAVPTGTILHLHLRDGRVMDSTTATNIVALSS